MAENLDILPVCSIAWVEKHLQYIFCWWRRLSQPVIHGLLLIHDPVFTLPGKITTLLFFITLNNLYHPWSFDDDDYFSRIELHRSAREVYF
jgi:hypothetical protein